MPKYKEASGISKIDTSKCKIELNLHAEKTKTKADKKNSSTDK